MSTKRARDPRNAALAVPFEWPKAGDLDSFAADFLTIASIGLGVMAVLSRSRLYSWGALLASMVANANKRTSDGASALNTTMFATMSILMSITFEIQQHQIEQQTGIPARPM